MYHPQFWSTAKFLKIIDEMENKDEGMKRPKQLPVKNDLGKECLS
jgi:hypothetical protein